MEDKTSSCEIICTPFKGFDSSVGFWDEKTLHKKLQILNMIYVNLHDFIDMFRILGSEMPSNVGRGQSYCYTNVCNVYVSCALRENNSNWTVKSTA